MFTPDYFQFGFRPLDRVARGIDTLDAVMSSCMKELRPFTIAILDLEKAFDTVCHSFIVKCLDELQIPVGIIEYLKFVYYESRTILSFKGNSSMTIHPEQGVRQGDLLSPLLFLIVFSKVLQSLPGELGIKLRNMIIIWRLRMIWSS